MSVSRQACVQARSGEVAAIKGARTEAVSKEVAASVPMWRRLLVPKTA